MANRLEKIAVGCLKVAAVVLGVSTMYMAYGTMTDNDYVLVNSLKIAGGTMATMTPLALTSYYLRDKSRGKN